MAGVFFLFVCFVFVFVFVFVLGFTKIECKPNKNNGIGDHTYYFIILYIFLITAIKVTGPLLPKPAQPLSAELETFMASAGDEGVIVVAFGSMVSSLPTPTLNMLTKVLGGMNHKVLWKIKGV